MDAFRAGQSPLAAFQAAQQQIFHVMANPVAFFAYLALLVALLFGMMRSIFRKTASANDYWFLAVALIAIVALVRNFVRFH